ncbi:hypothetical protein ZWY2020_050663 [Hordeum vulgare]|nr:hypothetical protein ZWY2020_050663 [Hordeum vulgare]
MEGTYTIPHTRIPYRRVLEKLCIASTCWSFLRRPLHLQVVMSLPSKPYRQLPFSSAPKLIHLLEVPPAKRLSLTYAYKLDENPSKLQGIFIYVVGFEGIMSAYSSTLYTFSLAGPTLFGPVINKAAEIASHSVQYVNNKYFVLIIMDGVITDEQETKDSIVRASDLPLSILIV